VLPVDAFNDSKNGYIFEGDQCEFGVNVIVAAPPTNWEIYTLHEALIKSTQVLLDAQEFLCDEQLCLHIRQFFDERKEMVSIYMIQENFVSRQKIYLC